MDAHAFDRLARRLAGLASRRTVLGGPVAVLGSLIVPKPAATQPRRSCRPLGGVCAADRGLACCAGTRCQGGRCRCPRGTRRCGRSCIPAGRCCRKRCGGGAVCRTNRCVCPAGKRRCQGRCIAQGRCCRDGDCPRGAACRGGRCRRRGCRPGTKACHGGCIPDDACCGGCPADQVCRTGGCCHVTTGAELAAALAAGPDVIRLCPATTYQGTFTIGRDVTVIGAGAASSILDGAGARGAAVVTVTNAVTQAELRALQVTGGRRGQAAGLRMGGPLSMIDCLVTGNEADSGGGMFTDSRLILDGTVVTLNAASSSGGGIFASSAGAQVTLRGGSQVAVNTAGGGGGIFGQAGAVITVEDTSTVADNDAVQGAGILVANATVILRGDSRIEGNIATADGGGVYLAPILSAGARLEMYDRSQITGNEALGGPDTGGGLFSLGGTINTVSINDQAAITGNDPDDCAPDIAGVCS